MSQGNPAAGSFVSKKQNVQTSTGIFVNRSIASKHKHNIITQSTIGESHPDRTLMIIR